MEALPAELLLHVFSYLTPETLVSLRSTSKRLRNVAGGNELWKSICFDHITPDPAFVVASLHLEENLENRPSLQAGRLQSLANWDPSYPGEQVDWYHEYVARRAPMSMNWLQTPIERGNGIQTVPESKGLGLLSTREGPRVVAPLDDGSVCLWDISHHERESCTRGTVLARSAPGTLSVDGTTSSNTTSKAKMTSTGVVECISIDSPRQKAYVAVQCGLNEVDLNTMQVSSYQSYPFSISALSDCSASTPLTVGTTLTLHLHDYRQPHNGRRGSDPARVDEVATFPTAPRQRTDFQRLLSGDGLSNKHAPLFQPGPLHILHLQPSAASNSLDGEIFVAGRFPSILMYDRRSFPRLRATLHSGARLCSMTSLPYSFKVLETDLMRYRQLSIRQVEAAKATPGDRLIACGEYNGKGSLEIYGLDADRVGTSGAGAAYPGQGQNSSFKNRVNAGRSKLLSVATHGTRIVVSDSDGNLRWSERNGSSLVRSWNLNRYNQVDESIANLLSFAPGTSDVGRKLLAIQSSDNPGTITEDGILVWTGERIGLVELTKRPRFGADPDDIYLDSIEAGNREQQIHLENTMRRALERQADELQWMRQFGV